MFITSDSIFNKLLKINTRASIHTKIIGPWSVLIQTILSNSSYLLTLKNKNLNLTLMVEQSFIWP